MRRTSLLRDGEHAERVVLAQVGLARGREPRQVGELPAVVGVHAGRVERLPVVRHVLVGVPQRPPQPLELQGAQLVERPSAPPGRGSPVGRRTRPPGCRGRSVGAGHGGVRPGSLVRGAWPGSHYSRPLGQ